MINRNWKMLAAALLTAAPLAADRFTEFRPRPTRDFNPRAAEGWCAVRVWVDDEVNVFVRGNRVMVETVRGRHPYDAGTECSGPLPAGPMEFRFRGLDGRGNVDLIEEPSRRNGFRSWVRIIDRRGGGEEHHFRIFWRAAGGGYGYDRGDRRDDGFDGDDRGDRRRRRY